MMCWRTITTSLSALLVGGCKRCNGAFLSKKLSHTLTYRPRGFHQTSLHQQPTKNCNHESTRIAVVGCGGVGGYYGARLWEAGYNVSFHMRGRNYEASKQNGLKVHSIYGDMFIPPNDLQAFERTEDMGKADWVVVSVKSTSLDAIPALVYPLLHEKTRIINIMNGLIENDLLSSFQKFLQNTRPSSLDHCLTIYGGMALICSSRTEPGVVRHTHAHKLSSGVAMSSPNHVNDEENKRAFEKLWAPVRVETVFEDSLLKGRWTKNVWNLPFNGISVAMGGISVDVIVKDPGLRSLAYSIMDETIAIANKDLEVHGHDPSSFLGEPEKKTMMDLSDNMGFYLPSTTLDLQNRRPMEVQYLFRTPLERARKLGVSAPHLETIVKIIEAWQRMYGLY